MQRMAFSTARMVTPTSPNTASHMSAMPTSARAIIPNLTASANAMFS